MAGLMPPFTEETAQKKVKAAQDLWNTKPCGRKKGKDFIPCILPCICLPLIALDICEHTSNGEVLAFFDFQKRKMTSDPARVAQAYTPTCIWRVRDSFFTGTESIIAFLEAKWNRERSYRLRKELFTFGDDRIAVQFWYEFQDAEDGMRWKRCYGLEDWTFDETGKMRKRMMSGK
ncbi:Protein of unknown function DUF1348 [Penicillium cf. griseofulvum]|nr:Protein of unknown function DUF1348 [Penicillium cf. griseofulvum]